MVTGSRCGGSGGAVPERTGREELPASCGVADRYLQRSTGCGLEPHRVRWHTLHTCDLIAVVRDCARYQGRVRLDVLAIADNSGSGESWVGHGGGGRRIWNEARPSRSARERLGNRSGTSGVSFEC